jgi:transposase
MYTLIGTAKLNGVDPRPGSPTSLARIADHPARHLADLLPWNWRPPQPLPAAA